MTKLSEMVVAKGRTVVHGGKTYEQHSRIHLYPVDAIRLEEMGFVLQVSAVRGMFSAPEPSWQNTKGELPEEEDADSAAGSAGEIKGSSDGNITGEASVVTDGAGTDAVGNGASSEGTGTDVDGSAGDGFSGDGSGVAGEDTGEAGAGQKTSNAATKNATGKNARKSGA